MVLMGELFLGQQVCYDLLKREMVKNMFTSSRLVLKVSFNLIKEIKFRLYLRCYHVTFLRSIRNTSVHLILIQNVKQKLK